MEKIFLQLSKILQYICIMENKKYQYKTLKVTTEQEYKKAEKLVLSGWVALNILCNGDVIQFCKEVTK